MKRVVLDASITLAWLLPDETNETADAVLFSLAEREVIVPSHWVLEVVNVLVVSQRRSRINKAVGYS